LFASSGEWRETNTQLGPLETANVRAIEGDFYFVGSLREIDLLKGSFSPPEDRSSFGNVVLSSYLEFRTMDRSTNPVILSVVHHRQNPSDPHVARGLYIRSQRYVIRFYRNRK
jgi:hypothetical protein